MAKRIDVGLGLRESKKWNMSGSVEEKKDEGKKTNWQDKKTMTNKRKEEEDKKEEEKEKE